MVAFLASLLGHVRGGLHYVLVAAMYLVSGISGAKAADMAAVAPVLFPEMKARGAKPGDLVALLSATGAQTETIPPSLVLITIGSVTGVSIAALFTGGLLPGVVLAFLLCFVVHWRYRHEDTGQAGRASKREIARAFLIALPAIVLPFLIRAAVVEGVATATEVSTIGIAYSAIAGLLIYRRFDWSALRPMLVSTACLSGAILLIIGTATGMAWGLTQSGFSRTLAAAMTGLPGGAATFMAASIAAFIVLGSVLEGIPAIVLFGPLLFPIAKAVGIHEVHYAMVVILAMGIGLFAPPFGVGYYAACAIGRVEPAEGMRPILGLYAGADDRHDHRRRRAVDLDRLSEIVRAPRMDDGIPKGGVAPSSKRVMNLAHFLRQTARRFGDEIGLVWGERAWTWAQLDRRVDAMAAALAARGCLPSGGATVVPVCRGRPVRLGRQLTSKRAVGRSISPRIMTLKATTIRSSASSAAPCSTAWGRWLGQITMRPFSAGTMKTSEFNSVFRRYVGSRFFESRRGDANTVGPQFFGVLM